MEPIIIVSLLGVTALLSEMFGFKKVLLPLLILGMAAALCFNQSHWGVNTSYYHDMLLVNNYSVAFSSLLIVVAGIWLVFSGPYFTEIAFRADRAAIIMFSLTGALVMISFSNLVMLFLGIEILSISMYILAGSNKKDPASNEAALKYLLMGAFATAFLLFGITLVYGVTGTFSLAGIADHVMSGRQQLPALMHTGILLMMVGMAFKVAAVPFHFWAPDVYEGAPNEVTSFMMTIVKTAAMGAFFRLFSTCFAAAGGTWPLILSVISALTILTGNIIALYQQNVKRMLAYSSIAHAGYLLMAVVAMNQHSAGALLFYLAAYAAATLPAFAVLSALAANGEGTGTEAFRGLAKRNPLYAFAMAVSLLSLAGIPPAAGFFAKYYLFVAAFQSHYIWLAITGVAGSLAGVYYYFRIITAMYISRGSRDETPIHASLPVRVMLLIVIAATVILGIFPGLLADYF